MRGSSQPFLAKANDGKTYVVKFSQNNCAGFLFNESAGSNLYSLFGLICPPWKPLILTDEFLDQNTGCWITKKEGQTRPPAGLCFGSEFLGDSEHDTYQILPGSWVRRIRRPLDFWRAWFLDICAEHYDARQALFRLHEDHSLQPWFIDHGFMFGGPDDRIRRKLAPRYLDYRIYDEIPRPRLLDWVHAVHSLQRDTMWHLLDSIPEEWKTAKALAAFSRFLDRLLDKDFGLVVLERMVSMHEALLLARSERSALSPPPCYGLFYSTGADPSTAPSCNLKGRRTDAVSEAIGFETAGSGRSGRLF